MAAPTQPVRPEQRPGLDAAEADRIAAVYDVRSYPVPPGELLTEQTEDYGHYDELFERAVAPHWNAAVGLLRSGADGYLALVRLRDRLAGHVAAVVHTSDEQSALAALARSVRRVVAREAERHGLDAVIGTSLDDRPPSATEDGWWWEPRRSWGQEEGTVVPDSPPAFFVLRSAYLDTLASKTDSEQGDIFVEVQRGWTWGRALGRATSTEGRFSRQRSGLGTDVADLAEFRLKVVEQVLREHELLGHVAEFGVGGDRRVRLSDEQADFVRAALAAVRFVEAEVDRGEASAPSWDAVQKQITADDESWKSKRSERVATELGAFEKGEGSGRPTDAQVRARYEQFRGRVMALARAAGADVTDEGV